MSINTKGCNTASPYKNMFIYMLRLMVAVAVLLPAKMLAQTTPQATYYVDPLNGNDGNSGTSLGSAFQTIEKARDVVRTINGNMTGDIYVYLRGGTYWLTSTINFTDADSGTNGFNIIYSAYNGEKPVLSGGKKIVNWTLHESCENSCQSIYKAKAGDIETRQLFVNGKRAIRARSTGNPSPTSYVKATGYTANGNIFANNAKPMDQWENLTDLEFVYGAAWTAPRVPVDSITYDGTKTTIAMQQPSWYWATHKGMSSVGGTFNNGYPRYIENAYELLDEEGEWYLNRTTDTIYYKPKANEDISTAIIIAPLLDELVRVQGTDLDHKAHNMKFIGITFNHTTYLGSNNNMGHIDSQNDICIDTYGDKDANGNYIVYNKIISAALNLKYANAIRLERNVFEQLGNTGINMYAGCQDNLVIGSRFFDLSGNGIQVGDYKYWNKPESENYGNVSDSRAILRNNDVINNYFESIGAEYFSSTAIAATFPQDMDVVHNEIGNVPYSGIHIGYGHDMLPQNVHKNTHIEYNYVHDVMRVVLDGGQIYVLGYTAGDATHLGTISNNYLQNLHNLFNALYCDNNSSWWSLDRNVINNAPTYYGGNDESHISVTNTYTNTGSVDRGPAYISNTTVVTDGNWPAEALAIMANAGLEQPYKDIKTAILPPEVKLYETFDPMRAAEAPEGWTVNTAGGDGTVIVQEASGTMNKNMQLSKTGTASGQDLVSSHGFESLYSGTVELQAKASQTNALVIPVSLNSGSNALLQIAFNNNGQIVYKNAVGTWVDIQSYTAGTTYSFKVEFDAISGTYNLYIDTVKVLADQAFAASGAPVDTVAQIIKSVAVGTMNVDNIKVYEGYSARPNVALNKTVTGFSSQVNTTSWKATNINDGKVGVINSNERAWASVAGSGIRNEWVKMDLGLFYTLSSFTIQNEDGTNGRNPKDFILYGSTTGVFEGEEFVLSAGTIPVLSSLERYTVAFPAKDARYLKFKATTGHNSYIVVGELSVNGVELSTQPLPSNFALSATATASSQFNSSFVASKVIDNNVEQEWASLGQQNPWIKLNWSSSRSINKILLFDRQNTTDNANGGTLTFSDGSSVAVSGIPTNGDPLEISFPSRSIFWVKFQVSGGTGSNVGLGEMQAIEGPPPPPSSNLALSATATASSQFNSSFVASKAIDNNVDQEWASLGQQNPWLQLTWNSSQSINKIVLFDRQNTTDNANGGTLTFSDGSSVPVNGIPTNGDPLEVSFPSKTIFWVKFQVSGGSGPNVGLGEMQAIVGPPPPPSSNLALSATATASSQYNSSFVASKAIDNNVGQEWASLGQQNPWIKLNWSSSQSINKIVLFDRSNTTENANGGTLTFSDGSSVPVSDIPTNGDPLEVSFPSKSIFWVKFQVSGGSGPNVGLAEMQAIEGPPPPPSSNLALSATATTSSQFNSSFVASKAIDNNVEQEWASLGQQNPWIQLNWSSSQSINKIVLFDRQNTTDNANGGTLTFSDGSSVAVSGIPVNGTQLEVSFPSKSVTWVKFQVSGGSGPNVGLAEMQAIEGPPPPPAVVSLNKTVTGFSSQFDNGAWKAANINDGVVGTVSSSQRGWASVSGSGVRNEWVTIDLGQSYTMSSFNIKNEDGSSGRNPKDFVLYGSATGAFAGEEFVISSGTIPSLTSLATHTVNFSATNARYVKFKATTGYNTYIVVGELSLYGN